MRPMAVRNLLPVPLRGGHDHMMIKPAPVPLRADAAALAALMVYAVSAVHELLHHLTGALLCQPGRMSLDLFIGGAGCPPSIAMSAAGPMLNYLLGWLGALLLFTPRRRLLGIGLVMASMPLVRYVGIVMGGNDEGVIARALLDPALARVAAPVLAGLFLMPPAILMAFALPARRRWRLWFALMSAPLLVLVPKKWLDQQLFGEWMRDASATLPNLAGVPWSVLLIHAVVVTVLVLTVWRTRGRAGALSQPMPDFPA